MTPGIPAGIPAGLLPPLVILSLGFDDPPEPA
jgi:hypothetical protein